MKIQAVKIPRWPVHGVLLLDKHSGIGSTPALARAKRALQALKAGHTGTLDPMASGLLPLCFGEATKFAADLLDADKSYEAMLQLGVTTTTGDAEGEVLETRAVEISASLIEAALATFRGPIEQIPPMYSALKRDGKPLYEYARAGVTLERAARAVVIHRVELTGMLSTTQLRISVDCSKGTYIRTLAEDIGAVLGCGAHLIALRRTRVGTLSLQDAVTLEQFEALPPAERKQVLQPVDTLIASLPRVDLDAALTTRFRQGQRLALTEVRSVQPGLVRVYGLDTDHHSHLLGTADWREDQVLAPARLVVMKS